VRIDSIAVILDCNTETSGLVLDLDLDVFGACVAERTDQRFATDPIDFIADDGMDGARLAFYGDLKDLFRGVEFVLNT
jgi:hypothetical protein